VSSLLSVRLPGFRFDLERRYCWVPRSELVQQYNEEDGLYELPKDDLLLD
jgi:hypothetical protein